MSFMAPASPALFLFGASGALPVFGLGRWWTVLSAGWLHGGVLHILFNMMWVRQLAPATAELYGPGRMVIIYTAGSIGGFALELVRRRLSARFDHPARRPDHGWRIIGAHLLPLGRAVDHGCQAGGSSAVGQPGHELGAVDDALLIPMPGIDNYVHAGGFGGGLPGVAPAGSRSKPERIDHLAMAVACLVLPNARLGGRVGRLRGLEHLGLTIRRPSGLRAASPCAGSSVSWAAWCSTWCIPEALENAPRGAHHRCLSDPMPPATTLRGSLSATLGAKLGQHLAGLRCGRAT